MGPYVPPRGTESSFTNKGLPSIRREPHVVQWAIKDALVRRDLLHLVRSKLSQYGSPH